MSSPVVYFGTDEHLSAPTLRRLISDQYPVLAVVTRPDSRRGRGMQLQSPAVKQIALEHNIPILQPTTKSDMHDQLSMTLAGRKAIGILVAYGKIIPQSVIDMFTPGIINLHPSLLPRYRGPSPGEAAILAGDDTTGVSIMQLAAAMDAGPVYAQAHIRLDGTETQPDLYSRLIDIGTDLLINNLPDIISGDLQPIPQDESLASYCPLISKSDGIIDPDKQTAAQICRQVRAYMTYPKSRLDYRGNQLIITAVHQVADDSSGPIVIDCADDTYLAIDTLITPTGRHTTAESYLRGLHR